ncbi:NAD-dependent succinate-semialdehyde dehydrogenase [Streptomyces sp. SL13]|uniref:NAD-dependent succinate-semialdehyde dehydrogenase n=1 Tax=Streptantibioticus silvisoli TaxID=2705255 RepID=A0AA90H0T8_9ACTN|nr:NAD-dependent succinate-semialdehyde dehydrogenase [Streptantibioticus silvisoli]MDI5966774.1 NAD-dependent succinate-semialdehyde dehydrogenase [Streptantibioticus silvisoli]MDI5971199.1 NAD-dependent succinate-semialdehyde dehydrogenase [Streptantibioticus silvisoli]
MTDHNETDVVERVPKGLLIGGSWRPQAAPGDGPREFQVEDPSLAEPLCSLPDAGTPDALDALDAAHAAQPGWAAVAPRERADILYRAYQELMRRQDDLALLMTLEMGKPVAESRGEIAYAAEFFRWFCEEAVRIDGGWQTSPDGNGRIWTMRQPVGPALLITPWNFPMAMGTRKIGPAIAAGCTMIIKPAHQTPLSMLALAGILQDAGLPAGVLNVLTTTRPGEVCEPLLRDGRIRKLSFTGSTKVGKLLLAQCADQVLRTSMELGGNAPLVVCEDADLDKAVAGAAAAKMRNIGEACTAANRMYVHASLAGEFTARLAVRLGAMQVGRGTEPDVVVGPLIDAAGRDKVARLVEDAVAEGAKPVLGGAPIEDRPGYFYPPTVLADVPATARLLREEIFGPVAPVVPFETDEEALALANDTEHGLVSYVFTENLRRALWFTERLESGMVGLNKGVVSTPAAPFGGIKQSGLGREGGRVGIEEFLETKYVALDA